MKTIDIKNDIKLFVYAALLCVFWYLIFIWADQELAAVFSAICALLALVNLSWLVLDTIHFIKHRLIHTPLKSGLSTINTPTTF